MATGSHGSFVLGEEVREFEERVAGYWCTTLRVGEQRSDALWLSLKALGIGPGDGDYGGKYFHRHGVGDCCHWRNASDG